MTDPTDLEKLIAIHRRRLQKLKEQQAMFGANTPPHVLLEIEDDEAELARLQAELVQMTGLPLPPVTPAEAAPPENPAPTQPPPLWSVALNWPPGSAAVVLGETLFVPTWPQAAPQAAHLHRLRLGTGEAIQPPLVFEGVLVSGLAAVPAAGLLLVGLVDLNSLGSGGALLALAESGAERWRWPAQTGAVSAPTVQAETVWVTTNQAELIGLAQATGQVEVRHSLATSPYLVAPAVGAGRAFVVGRTPALVAVGLAGQPGWQFQPEPPGRVETTPWLDPTGERLFVAVSETGLVVALSVETGAVLWQTRVGPAGKPLGPLTGDGQRLFVGSRAGLHALDPASGELPWQQPLARGVQAAPVVVDGLVYAAGRNHHLSAFESATGDLMWQASVARRLEQPPLIVRAPQPLALVVDHGGTVTALRRPLSQAEQPRLSVTLEHEILAFQAWSRLRFVVHNEGGSAARQVVIRAKGGQFEGQVAETRQLMTLAAGQTKDDWLDLRPLAHGDSVPLRLTIDYQDESGQPHTWQETRYLPVSAVPVAPGSRMARVHGAKKPGPALGPVRHRWALLVGVNHYIDPTLSDLHYCVNDVLVLGNQLAKLGYTVVSLHDEAAEERLLPDSENIEAELTRLCQAAEPEDLMWVHFAGHGLVVAGQPLLLTRRSRRDILPKSGLLLTDLEKRLRESGVRRLALTLDACHVGVELGRDATDPDFVRHAHDLAEGFALLAAGTARQVAQESALTQHGLFTYYLLEGLAGQAARNDNPFVTVDDLKTYVLDHLRRWSIQHGGFLQEPTARTDGLGDMTLADFRRPPTLS